VTQSPIRVLVADDHPVFRNGLGALIRDAPATELVGASPPTGRRPSISLGARSPTSC
jgi:hypothetical protein